MDLNRAPFAGVYYEVNESLHRFHDVDVPQYRLTVAVRDAVNRRAIAARNLVLAVAVFKLGQPRLA